MKFSRMTVSMWDSASVKRWFKHLFHAPKLPRVFVCFLNRTAALCSNLDVRYCDANIYLHVNHLLNCKCGLTKGEILYTLLKTFVISIYPTKRVTIKYTCSIYLTFYTHFIKTDFLLGRYMIIPSFEGGA
ncbi:hypothetical protein HanRHA438_Chr09g0403661 [Helianthus annuus]|nr:hypothetical protein HanRHA438_Chr09g0403661 [Helianthus annuus]